MALGLLAKNIYQYLSHTIHIQVYTQTYATHKGKILTRLFQ